MKISSIPSTLQGLTALLLWATSASIISMLSSLPPYEILSLSFFTAGLYTIFKIIMGNEWKTLKAAYLSWILVATGVLLQQILYIMAFNSAHPAEVDLIIYLWPSIAIVLSTIFFREKIRWYHIVSVLFGTLGIVCMTSDNISFSQFQWGHLCAFLCAVSWSTFSVFSRKSAPIHPNMFGIIYAVGLILIIPLHLSYEEFIMPSITEFGLLIYYTICCTLAAFSLWTNGMQKGFSRYLILTAYIKPVVSLSLLCLLGFAEPTFYLMLATICITIAGVTTNLGLSPYFRTSKDKTAFKALKPSVSQYN